MDLMPIFSKLEPPTDKYSIFLLSFWSLEIAVEANLSPDGSPVNTNIFFQNQITKEHDR